MKLIIIIVIKFNEKILHFTLNEKIILFQNKFFNYYKKLIFTYYNLINNFL